MRFLKLHCKDIQGPTQVTVTLPGTNTSVQVWIVQGVGVEITYDSSGNQVVIGTEMSYLGFNVAPAYRAAKCGTSEGDIVIGVTDIRQLES